jgi:hypothetical protein
MHWVAKGWGRTVEVWEPHNARKMFVINGKTATPDRVRRCEGVNIARAVNPFVPPGGDDRFTIAVPGLSDLVRIPGIDSKATRFERFQRYQASRSPLPQFLQPFVAILNKLDDAQDLLFTALVLARPLIRWVGARFIPYLGWALLANDILNGFT